MRDSRIKGRSSGTGRLVTVRHAGEADVIDAGRMLGKRLPLPADPALREIVVARENERMIGFGLLERRGDRACLMLMENGRRRGIGRSILRHLLEYAGGVRRVAASGETARYLAPFGFRRQGRAACPRGEKNGTICCGEGSKGLAFYERTAAPR